ncbi:hypothetical protein [Heliophilum fasciatum]|uniref:hypothetical protein n=1 Tax=Heliophilum fasciatum TaxID=35700 RepID=UPI001FAAFF0A|nr:hypothetical protein [Heliophilum fasciatum]MCW2278360.1 hypothetical protein [Heliophilum fasciatum]
MVVDFELLDDYIGINGNVKFGVDSLKIVSDSGGYVCAGGSYWSAVPACRCIRGAWTFLGLLGLLVLSGL